MAKKIKPPPAITPEEAMRKFSEAWKEWHNMPDTFLSDNLINASWDIVTAAGLQMNENPETGKWELVKL